MGEGMVVGFNSCAAMISVAPDVPPHENARGCEVTNKDHRKSSQRLCLCPSQLVGRRADPLWLDETEMPDVPNDVCVCPIRRVEIKQWRE